MTETNKPSSVACLRIIGNNLDAALISSHVGITPRSVLRRGEQHFHRIQQHDVIIYEVTPRSSRGFSEQLSLLQELLAPALDFLTELKKTADVHIYCSFVTDWAQSGFSITPDSIKRFVDAGLNIEISIFSWGLVEGTEEEPEQKPGSPECSTGVK